MGLGLSGAFGVVGAQSALRQRIFDSLAQQKQQQDLVLAEREQQLREHAQQGLDEDRRLLRQQQMKAEADRLQGVADKQTETQFTMTPQGGTLPPPLALRSRALGLPVIDNPGTPVRTLGGFQGGLPPDPGAEGAGMAPVVGSLRVRSPGAVPGGVTTSSADPTSPLAVPPFAQRGATEADVNKTQAEALAAQRAAEIERKDRAAEARQSSQDAATADYRAGMLAKPTAGDTSLVKVEHQDENGRTVIEYLPKDQVRGKVFKKGVTGATETRLASAEAVTQTGNDIIAKVSDPAFAKTLGPALGRYSSLQDFIGNPPPEFAEFAGMIESYAIANMGVHGMRSVQGAEMIRKLIQGHHTPESIAAGVKGLNGFAGHFMENEGRKSSTPATANDPAGIR